MVGRLENYMNLLITSCEHNSRSTMKEKVTEQGLGADTHYSAYYFNTMLSLLPHYWLTLKKFRIWELQQDKLSNPINYGPQSEI